MYPRPQPLRDGSQVKLAYPRNSLGFELYSDGVDKREPTVFAGHLPLVTVNHVGRLQNAIEALESDAAPTVLDENGALVHVSSFDDTSLPVIRDGYTLTGFEPENLYNRACLICSADQHEQVEGETLVYMGDEYVHGDCLEGFVDCLDTVWDYTDALLPNQL